MQALPPLSFCEAIKLSFKNYFKCSGRVRRSEFFISFLLFHYLWGISTVGLAFIFIFDIGSLVYVFAPILIILILLSLWPLIKLIILRLHDTGRSGYFIFIFCIPFGFVPLIYFLFLDSEKETNKYGPSPKYIHKDFSGLESNFSTPINSNDQYYYTIQ